MKELMDAGGLETQLERRVVFSFKFPLPTQKQARKQ